ncbi:MAG: hypothetical protein FJ096_21950, partial [Deltaproteobacteria bacterium]|nr:hypothetical protein [Deltaproteobacteria bacterium]
YVASGPLVRSSYKAAEVFLKGMLRRRGVGEGDASAVAGTDGVSGAAHDLDVEAALEARLETARREAARVAAMYPAPSRDGEAPRDGATPDLVPVDRLLRRPPPAP